MREEVGDYILIRWVPSHLQVPGNDGADELARQGRNKHPNNLLPLSKCRRVTECKHLGLVPMPESELLEWTRQWSRGERL